MKTQGEVCRRGAGLPRCHNLCAPAKLQVPGGDSDEESKTPSASPRHGRSRPSSSVQESSSESEDGDSRGEVCVRVGGLGLAGDNGSWWMGWEMEGFGWQGVGG